MAGCRFTPLAGLVFALSTQVVLAQRVLIEAPGSTAFLEHELQCGRSLAVRIEADHPEFFAPGSVELQSMVDVVRAMLAYACPRLSELQISGQLKGLDQQIYQATSTQSARWVIEPLETVHTEAIDATARPATQPAPSPSDLTVANLARGMSVPAAQAAIRETFGVASRYDREGQALTMRAEGCPQAYDWTRSTPRPQPGWKCLRAWFTREAEPRLYRLLLVQVVEGEQSTDVERALVDRYGEPRERWTTEREGRWLAADRELKHLAWGRLLDRAGQSADAAGPNPAYELQASVEVVDGSVVAIVTLSEPTRKPAGDRASDLTL